MPPKPTAAAATKDIRGFFTHKRVRPTTSKHFVSTPRTGRVDIGGTPPVENQTNRTDNKSSGGQKRKKAVKVMLSSDSESTVEPPRKKVSTNASASEMANKGGLISKPHQSKPTPTTRNNKGPTAKAENDHNAEENADERYTREESRKEALPKKSLEDAAVKNEARKKDSVAEEVDKAQAKKARQVLATGTEILGPPQHGSKVIPEGEANCLAGLTFVFTGELTSLGRDEAIDLAKRYGGRVTGQPSSKTSYVVIGEDAGPSKLNAIKKHKLSTLNEDEFLNLIATRKGIIDKKTMEKLEKENAKIRQDAKEMERQEQKQEAQASRKAGFKKPGKHGMNTFRAMLITGSPGIGKTTAAHLCAKLEGYTPIELNASDARSKKLVENATNINNTSLDGWMSRGEGTLVANVLISNRSVLIMDEVDGMSAGDRGGVGALNALIKKTKIPIICIANDAQAQKLKPLSYTTYHLPFKKPETNAIRSRILSICFKEGLEIPANVVDQLIQGSQSDIRQVITMLSTWRLSNETMDFDQGQALAKMNEKYTLMTPWGIMNKILGPYSFSATSRETLNDRMDLYFQDHGFVPMFMQENYLKPEPARAKSYDGPERDMKKLELLDRAASAISDGDLIDAMIHSSEQHWSLMPFHAIESTVIPAYLMYGQGAHWGPNGMTFPSWFGQNSKQSRLQRQLNDIQTRMRLRVSGDKTDIRMSYIPALHLPLVEPLAHTGAPAIDDVITCMDMYYLSKEDWDTILELGVGDHKDEKVLKTISAATKSAFTRNGEILDDPRYNLTEHPIAFHKADDLRGAPKKLAAVQLPDLEEAFELDELIEDEKEEKPSQDPTGISDDKLLKMGGKKGRAASKTKPKTKTN
ncbi:hypothetical protein Clacol_001633 [Clathrus columnatus]|uniref:Replication factor C subunit 1 n=1 Tax=Clathrus columnatus TaxID=1419009 RepID=A0AAV5A4A1_9AGAM|nr:hypothetical protein Clacol_001633 [Clathrus columnatus]